MRADGWPLVSAVATVIGLLPEYAAVSGSARLGGTELLGMADLFGASRVPLYILNVAYPLVDDEVVRFCRGKRAVLVVEAMGAAGEPRAAGRRGTQQEQELRILSAALPQAEERTGGDDGLE